MLPDAEVVYRKGCDIIDPHFPESEILDFPKTEEERRLMDLKAVPLRKMQKLPLWCWAVMGRR